jgi:hypothetical protein
MSTPTGVASDEASMKLPTSCPYIGMASDPQTHVGIPDSRNYCHLVSPPGAVYISHQQESCLSNSFPNCAVYQTSGEGPFPDGILEDSKSPERGFALGLFGLRRAQIRASKQSTHDVISEPGEGVKSESEQKSESNPESESDPLLVSNSKQESEPLSEVTTDYKSGRQRAPKPEPALAALAASSAIVNDDKLSIRPYSTPRSRYQQARKPKQERKGFWIILMLAALLVLLFSVWGIYNWMQKQQYEAQAQAELGYTISLATAVQDMGAAAEAWGTAASLLQAQQETSTAAVISTATADQLALFAQKTSQASTAIALTATPTSQVAVCRNITDAALEIISGPNLTPSPGTIYRPSLSRPQASWVVQNTGNCGWSQLLLWSTLDNTIVQPIIRVNGELVTPSANSDQALVAPGEQIEIVLEFPAISAQRIKGNWVLVADGLSLVSQPHMEMSTTNWIVLAIINTPKPTTRPGKPGGEPGPQPPAGATPPPRDTPAPTEVPVPTRPG